MKKVKRFLKKRTPWQRGVLLLLLALAAYFGAKLWSAIVPAQPSAFYAAPNPLPAAPAGTLLRSEVLTADLPQGAQAWRILYLSTGMQGEPIVASAVVVSPTQPASAPRPVLAWAHGTVGILPQCATSHTPHPYQQIPNVQLMIDEGFVMVAADYPGLGTSDGMHPYLIGPVTAFSVLDSVRAAAQLDIDAGDRFAVWGASQGGHASLWTAQLAAEYAPELTLVAGAASAPAHDLAGFFEANLDTQGGGVFISEVLYAWSHHYPEIDLDTLIKPELRDKFNKLATTCLTAPLAFLFSGGIVPPNVYLVDALDTNQEPWKSLLSANTPSGPIEVPLLITHGAADDIIPIELSQAEANRRCALGEQVTFIRLPNIPHDARQESAILTIGWIQDRFDGVPAGDTCANNAPAMLPSGDGEHARRVTCPPS